MKITRKKNPLHIHVHFWVCVAPQHDRDIKWERSYREKILHAVAVYLLFSISEKLGLVRHWTSHAPSGLLPKYSKICSQHFSIRFFVASTGKLTTCSESAIS